MISTKAKNHQSAKVIGVWAVMLIGCFTLGAPVTYAPGHDRIAASTPSVATFDRMAWFRETAFVRMIETHDRYLPELVKWRRLFARHATELAGLVKTFPGSEDLSEVHLRQIISHPEAMYDSLANKDVFAPWTNRWSGRWSNGSPQHHIWDSTRFVNERWIQPVTLSETEFVDYCRVGEMLQSHKTDVAINVFTRDGGITGWVSKRQHGRVELPHIGYLVNATTLIWICQIKEPEKLFAPDNRWFVFLETIHGSNDSTEYRIYGQPLVITDKISVDSSEPGKHHGTYYSANSNNSSGS